MDSCWEYQWPLGGKEHTTYVPSQEVKRFLRDDRLKESYADLNAKVMGGDEVKFLQNLGLKVTSKMAIPLEKLLPFMRKKHPAKYTEYMSTLHGKALDVCGVGAKVPVAPEFMKKIVDSKRSLAQRAIRKAAQYNAEVGRQRRVERTTYYDTQTGLVHYPALKRRCVRRQPPIGNYPVAVLPGQYQDYCPHYTPEQLNCLPLNTMLSTAPPPPPESVIPASNLSNSNSSSSSASALAAPTAAVAAASSLTPASRLQSRENSTGAPASSAMATAASSTSASQAPPARVTTQRPQSQAKRNANMKRDTLCGLCLHGPEENRKGAAEALISCSTCPNSGHPSCLELSEQAVRILRTYDWQCMECKVCMLCSDPGDEEKMMFCDDCDRGYHTFCVGLQDIPTGQWMCQNCSTCESCQKHETNFSYGNPCTHQFTIPRDGEIPKYVCTLCTSCSGLHQKGHFCPVCLVVYRNDESDRPMVCCDACDRWVHSECDNISEALYSTLSKEQSTYKCVLCRGGRAERMDAFHKKHRSFLPAWMRK